MASDQRIVDYICEQANLPGQLSYRKMFGEYALYLDGKVIALICNNLLYVKPTPEGRVILGRPNEAPPYPGAKLHFQLGDEIEDRDLLCQLFRGTWAVLPEPKPKKPKQAKPIKSASPAKVKAARNKK
jgi:TfoX/Sxy family transcriptional regulator of competence genes